MAWITCSQISISRIVRTTFFLRVSGALIGASVAWFCAYWILTIDTTLWKQGIRESQFLTQKFTFPYCNGVGILQDFYTSFMDIHGFETATVNPLVNFEWAVTSRQSIKNLQIGNSCWIVKVCFIKNKLNNCDSFFLLRGSPRDPFTSYVTLVVNDWAFTRFSYREIVPPL